MMKATRRDRPGTGSPSAADAELARESGLKLAKLLRGKMKTFELRISRGRKPDETVSIPMPAFRLLADILGEMAGGNAVTLLPVHSEITTQEAADLLNVSRPYLIELLEKGRLPHRKVGTHRRILFKDVLAYKDRTTAARRKALEQLSALDQELGGPGYEP